MNAVERALLAVVASAGGDTASALVHLSDAQRLARTTTRRERQIVEIAALVVAGAGARAAGLAFEHIARFPGDADRLAQFASVGQPNTNQATESPPAGAAPLR